ncbi:MAG: hypothetical protein ABI480_14215 [Chitinophagaceae bacterium]
MMKDLVKRAKSFMTFDYPLQTAYISTQFANTHKKLQTETPGWSTAATRQKLISDYWFTYVLRHFALMFGSPVLLVFFVQANFEQANVYLLSVLLAGFLSYSVMYLFHYRPYFSSTFLPRLETVKETFEQRERDQLEKCRKAQFRNPTLVLIHYVINIVSGMNSLQPNDKSAEWLMRLYGVDAGSLKNNMDLFIGSSIKKRDLKDRKKTEISNRFVEAYQFFEEINFLKGVEILKELEIKFFKQ